MKKVIIVTSAVTVIFCALITTILLTQQPTRRAISISGLSQGKTSHINKEGKLNINTATKEELQLLEGIGEVLSQSIVDYRTTNGNFTCIDELMNISGIGPATLENIAKYIYVE